MKFLSKILGVLAVVFAIAGCNYAPSNVKTIQTTDCGRTWTLIKSGERIPTTTGMVCSYNVALPDYPMQGDTEFLTQFQNNVLVRVQMSYDYQISDPIKYIEYAKFLGRMKGSSDDSANASNNKAYETAENVVIDVRLRELVTSSTGGEDVVRFNPSEFEDKIFKEASKLLEERGVGINSMTFVILPEEQTRMAIDAATAVSVYESKNLGEFGRQLAIAKAGAARITLNSAEKN